MLESESHLSNSSDCAGLQLQLDSSKLCSCNALTPFAVSVYMTLCDRASRAISRTLNCTQTPSTKVSGWQQAIQTCDNILPPQAASMLFISPKGSTVNCSGQSNSQLPAWVPCPGASRATQLYSWQWSAVAHYCRATEKVSDV